MRRGLVTSWIGLRQSVAIETTKSLVTQSVIRIKPVSSNLGAGFSHRPDAASDAASDTAPPLRS